ncbi:MAG: hypothetical protein UR23_C0002G0002 [Candidatus Roizmanbacteria bacterium GW2011_GWA2_32_13]|uniref:Helix-turn-helix domain-containing protein n=1 Tax=Candidatus Roizmanbacteria bacterium GW2011_GWA2_32_13 TaxID=1618475 RepID=A0A0G0C2S4_9BACT|nr:MAG: hypothetical protein UR23_C0002G0002 [Candidatus Roizmanbacteria bacterium GW2011_GWA2_32_13]
MEKTYTVKQVADILGYSTNSIYTFLKEERIVGIRVGKGRFRISQSELNKILHLQKNEVVQSRVQNVPITQIVQPPVTIPQPEETIFEKHLEHVKGSAPSLFDWFISLVSIITGLTMIVFVRNFEESANMTLSQFLLPVKINLLMAGIGLFIINYLNRTKKGWFYVFYTIIIVNFIGQALILLIGKDLLGFFFYGLTSIIILFHLILSPKGTITYRIFIALLTIFFTIILILFPSIINLNQISTITGLPTNLILLLWFFLSCLTNIVIWLSEKEKNIIYWTSFIIVSLGLTYFSYLYSTQLYWNRTFIFILMGQFLLISSFWSSLDQNYRDNRKIVINIFTDIVLIFLVIMSIIWIIQNNTRINTQQTLINRLVYGKNILEAILNSSTEKMESFTNSELLREAIDKKDFSNVNDLVKNFFIYSTNFRRVLMANKDGNIKSIYPFVDMTTTNISFEEYFKQVKSNKKTYISNLYETKMNGTKRQVVSINVPIFDKQNNFIGILIGSLDIDMISVHLQQIASLENKEYFLLLDRTGEPIVIPENTGLSKGEKKQLINNIDNSISIGEALDSDNKLIEVHDRVDDIGWSIAIRRPLLNTYNLDNITNVLLNLIFLISGLLIIVFNIVHMNR